MLSVRQIFPTRIADNPGPKIRQLSRWTGLFLFSPPQGPFPPCGWPDPRQLTLQLVTRARPGPFFAPQPPPERGQTGPHPLPRPAWRRARFGTHLGATGGTKTHARRTGGKLGQTRRARQELVRVPESNTKYGGKDGITGGDPAPVMEPSISESSRIPKGKKVCRPVEQTLHPLFTGQVFIRPDGLHREDSPVRAGREGWHARGPVVRCPNKRQSGGRFHPCRAP